MGHSGYPVYVQVRSTGIGGDWVFSMDVLVVGIITRRKIPSGAVKILSSVHLDSS